MNKQKKVNERKGKKANECGSIRYDSSKGKSIIVLQRNAHKFIYIYIYTYAVRAIVNVQII